MRVAVISILALAGVAFGQNAVTPFPRRDALILQDRKVTGSLFVIWEESSGNLLFGYSPDGNRVEAAHELTGSVHLAVKPEMPITLIVRSDGGTQWTVNLPPRFATKLSSLQLPPGQYTIEISAPRHPPARRAFAVATGTTVQLGTIVVP